ncbi:MAG: primosomal protein N', partial [Pseudomonadota bacterium]
MQTVSVLLPIPVDRPYSYSVPDGMTLLPGDLVQVPIGPRQVAAAVWDGSVDNVDPEKLKQVEKKFDCPPLDETMRRFVDWLANYYVAPAGMVLKMVLRVPEAFDPPGFVPGLRYAGGTPDRITPARTAVLELAREGGAWTKSGLAHAAGVSASVVAGLSNMGILEPVEIPLPNLTGDPDTDHNVTELNDAQQEAAARLRGFVEEDAFTASLLDGITGSGKTEVYFEAVSAALRNGKQVLILLPEISLTTSFLDRFEKRFGTRPAEWHSDISPKKREQCWRQVATGKVRVVAGARSALFLPMHDLGLIVVDEEHDPAFKQEDRVCYNARDMAVVRAHLGNFPIILSSATPSIESQVNAEQGRYQLVKLPQRFAGAELPELKVVDMRRNAPPAGKFISKILIDAIERTIEKGEQSMLFLNRRGYAPLTLCRVCGHRFECSECSAWLVEHRFRRQLQCHHCGYSEPVPEACPNCGALDHLVACGPGVERLGEEVDAIFPDARTIVLSSDMTGGVKRLRLELDAVANGEADIVIGTQLVAKGHNFPLMTCVGVVDADLGLANGDPRAAERTFQLLSQVTG